MANGYVRLLDAIVGAKKERPQQGFEIGVVGAGGEIKIDSLTLDKDDYILLTNELIINGEKVTFPRIKKKKIDAGGIEITVPGMRKGESVLCYRLDDETYIMLGKVD